jgi:hypothetical protein
MLCGGLRALRETVTYGTSVNVSCQVERIPSVLICKANQQGKETYNKEHKNLFKPQITQIHTDKKAKT